MENYIDSAMYVWYERLMRDVLEGSLGNEGKGPSIIDPQRVGGRDGLVERATLREPGLIKNLPLGMFYLGQLDVDQTLSGKKIPKIMINDIGELYEVKLGKRPPKDDKGKIYAPYNARKPAILSLFDETLGHQFFSGEHLVIYANQETMDQLGLTTRQTTNQPA